MRLPGPLERDITARPPELRRSRWLHLGAVGVHIYTASGAALALLIVLAAVDGDKVQLAAGVTADSMAKVKAGELVNFVAQQVGGKGGGKPDLAMAGGTDARALPAALASVAAWVSARL